MWSKGESECEYATLYKGLVDDEKKFSWYFRMTKKCFPTLLEKSKPITCEKKKTSETYYHLRLSLIHIQMCIRDSYWMLLLCVVVR